MAISSSLDATMTSSPAQAIARTLTPDRSTALIKHPAVKMAAAIGKKDPDFVPRWSRRLSSSTTGYAASDNTIRELQAHVRAQLAAHERSLRNEFLDELPMTTTGKSSARPCAN